MEETWVPACFGIDPGIQELYSMDAGKELYFHIPLVLSTDAEAGRHELTPAGLSLTTRIGHLQLSYRWHQYKDDESSKRL